MLDLVMMEQRPLILGLSGSLRNSRFGAGSKKLVSQLSDCRDELELGALLKREAYFCVEEFLEAGKARGLSFDEIYRKYQGRRGDRGLSNSEVALAAGLWGALRGGARVEHISLDSVFGNRSSSAGIVQLREKLIEADGILVSGPVYFGDRGSLVQDFIEFMRTDPQVRSHLSSNARRKAYAGISVGAKRNGGQETSLIYQLLDMASLGFLVVGNDAQSTAQYGGTGWAGDVGTMAKDKYGLTTAIGAGRRLSEVVSLLSSGFHKRAQVRPRIGVWVLQDKDGKARQTTEDTLFGQRIREAADIGIFDFTGQSPRRCIACDICPTDFGPDEEYRCIIKNPDDLFANFHQDLLGFDGIVLVGYSAADVSRVVSVYQRFIERTRYLRRGDYALSNAVVLPLVFEEVGARDSLSLRMLTSMIRHHTVMSSPTTINIWNGQLLNTSQAQASVDQFIADCRLLACGKQHQESAAASPQYNPIGYNLSAEKARQQREQWSAGRQAAPLNS